MKEKEDYRDIAGNFFKKMLASQREKSQPLAEWQHEDREYLKNPPFTVGRLYVVKNEFRRFNQMIWIFPGRRQSPVFSWPCLSVMLGTPNESDMPWNALGSILARFYE